MIDERLPTLHLLEPVFHELGCVTYADLLNVDLHELYDAGLDARTYDLLRGMVNEAKFRAASTPTEIKNSGSFAKNLRPSPRDAAEVQDSAAFEQGQRSHQTQPREVAPEFSASGSEREQTEGQHIDLDAPTDDLPLINKLLPELGVHRIGDVVTLNIEDLIHRSGVGEKKVKAVQKLKEQVKRALQDGLRPSLVNAENDFPSTNDNARTQLISQPASPHHPVSPHQPPSSPESAPRAFRHPGAGMEIPASPDGVWPPEAKPSETTTQTSSPRSLQPPSSQESASRAFRHPGAGMEIPASPDGVWPPEAKPSETKANAQDIDPREALGRLGSRELSVLDHFGLRTVRALRAWLARPDLSSIPNIGVSTVGKLQDAVALFERGGLAATVFGGDVPVDLEAFGDAYIQHLEGDGRVVIEGRFIRGETLDAIGESLSLTRERIRQIEKHGAAERPPLAEHVREVVAELDEPFSVKDMVERVVRESGRAKSSVKVVIYQGDEFLVTGDGRAFARATLVARCGGQEAMATLERLLVSSLPEKRAISFDTWIKGEEAFAEYVEAMGEVGVWTVLRSLSDVVTKDAVRFAWRASLGERLWETFRTGDVKVSAVFTHSELAATIRSTFHVSDTEWIYAWIQQGMKNERVLDIGEGWFMTSWSTREERHQAARAHPSLMERAEVDDAMARTLGFGD